MQTVYFRAGQKGISAYCTPMAVCPVALSTTPRPKAN